VSAITLLATLFLKPAILVCVALVMTLLMRRHAARYRHAVWTAVLGATLALPVLAAVLPAFRLTSLNNRVRQVELAAQHTVAALQPDRRPTTVPARNKPAAALDSEVPSPAHMVTAIWLIVALFLCVRRAAAEWQVRQLLQRTREPCDHVAGLGAELGAEPGTIWITDSFPSPVVAGIVRPVVLLPAVAETWSAARLRPVLVHELGHVERRDCLFNFVADVVANLYWCNPLVRYATKRMRLEAERACDERVVSGGMDPHKYARLLVQSARVFRQTPVAWKAITAMSRARELESRIVALLLAQARPARLPVRAVMLMIGVGTAMLLPTAALTMGSAAPALNQTTPEPDQLGSWLASPESERLPFEISDARLAHFAAEARAGRDSMLAMQLIAAASQPPRHDADFVAHRSRWALSRVRDGKLIEPLLASLGDADWRVQAYGAWTLAVAGDTRAVPYLVPLLRHPVWRARAMAAASLQALGDVQAAPAMRAALSDPAWQVRAEAVAFLGVLDEEGDRDALHAALNDRHMAVRIAAQRALHLR
jgi:beta-lactamase regulating signal transducer with metallopeptidase domain